MTNRETEYVLVHIAADATNAPTCILCANPVLPPAYVILTAPTKDGVRHLCERCIRISAGLLGEATV